MKGLAEDKLLFSAKKNRCKQGQKSNQSTKGKPEESATAFATSKKKTKSNNRQDCTKRESGSKRAGG